MIEIELILITLDKLLYIKKNYRYINFVEGSLK